MPVSGKRWDARRVNAEGKRCGCRECACRNRTIPTVDRCYLCRTGAHRTTDASRNPFTYRACPECGNIASTTDYRTPDGSRLFLCPECHYSATWQFFPVYFPRAYEPESEED